MSWLYLGICSGVCWRCSSFISARCCSVSKSSPSSHGLELPWNFGWLNVAVCRFTFRGQTVAEHREPVNTMRLPLTASWTVRIQVLGSLRTQLVKKIGRVGRSTLCVSSTLNPVDFSKRMKILSVSAFIPVLSKRFISLSVFRWELGGFIGVGCILDIAISAPLVHLAKSDCEEVSMFSL